jgi:hypothetical protein
MNGIERAHIFNVRVATEQYLARACVCVRVCVRVCVCVCVCVFCFVLVFSEEAPLPVMIVEPKVKVEVSTICFYFCTFFKLDGMRCVGV